MGASRTGRSTGNRNRLAGLVIGSLLLVGAACTTPSGGGGGGGPTNGAPNAVALASPVSGTPPLTVNFDGSFSTDTDGTIVSYEWREGTVVLPAGEDPSPPVEAPAA